MRHKFIFWFILTILFLILSKFYNDRVSFNNSIFFNKQTIELSADCSETVLDLKNDDYLLRVHYKFKEGEEELYFNGIKLEPTIKLKNICKVNYVILPKGIVNNGRNLLTLKFLKGHPDSFVVRVKNYYLNIHNLIYVFPPGLIHSIPRSLGFSFGKHRIVLLDNFVISCLLLLSYLVSLFLFLKYLISKRLKHNLTLPRNHLKEEKIELIGKIILVGFISAVVYHLGRCVLFGFYYPNTTFLYSPSVMFTDFFNLVLAAKRKDFFLLNSYYPLGNLILYFFSFFPLLNSFIIYMGLFIVAFIYINSRSLGQRSRGKFLKNVFIFSCLSYPFLFTVDRANMEGYLFVFLYLFFYFYAQRKFILSVLFLFLTIGMKGYPIIFLVLYLSDKRYREILFVLFLILLSSLLLYKFNLLNISGISGGFNIDTYSFIGGGNNVIQRGVSLFTLFKIFFIETGNIHLVDMQSFLKLYLKAVSFLLILVTGYLVFFKEEFWKKAALLVFSALLFPHISAEYKLLQVFIPLFLFIDSPKKSKFNSLYVLMFGLLLIPKDYYFSSKSVSPDSAVIYDISISIVLNIFIMFFMMCLIILERFLFKEQALLEKSAAKAKISI